MKKEKLSKVKATFMVNGLDLHSFKQAAAKDRTTCSVLISQYIHQYITKRGGKANA